MPQVDVVFDRRVQLLIDKETYGLVAEEAKRSGRTVNAVIREAITEKFADVERQRRRAEAGAALLERLHRPPTGEAPYTLEELAEGHYGDA